jgi:hypothetical protein
MQVSLSCCLNEGCCVAVIAADDGSTDPPLARGLEFNVPKRIEGEYVNNSTETYKFLYDRVFEPTTPQVRVLSRYLMRLGPQSRIVITEFIVNTCIAGRCI